MKTIIFSVATALFFGLSAYAMSDKAVDSPHVRSADTVGVDSHQMHQLYYPSALLEDASEARRQIGYVRN